jgi:hypothetical protein
MTAFRVFRSVVFVVLIALLATATITGPARAEGSGRYQTLAAKWWAWAAGFPAGPNPIDDPTGALCAEGQRGTTWFLAGTMFGAGPVERTCTVPAGTKLFFPVVNSVCADFPGVLKMPYDQIRGCAAASVDQFDPALMTATVDGASVPIVRAQSALFPLVLPEDNIFGCPECAQGHLQEVADGYWVLLDPLAPGDHVIHFAVAGVIDVTYHITVA